jgi:hypothetical protein
MEDPQITTASVAETESTPNLESAPEEPQQPEAEQVQAEEEKTEKVASDEAEAAVASEQPQPQVMRAAIYRRYGSPDELELTSQHPKPKCVKKRDVLVRVHATSINPVDWKLMAGNLSIVQFGKIFPFTPCFDVSGVVEDVGTRIFILPISPPLSRSCLALCGSYFRISISSPFPLPPRRQLQAYQEGR